MGIGFHRTKIIDRNHLDIGPTRLDDGAQHVPPDPTEAVDCHLDRHLILLAGPRRPLGQAWAWVSLRQKDGRGFKFGGPPRSYPPRAGDSTAPPVFLARCGRARPRQRKSGPCPRSGGLFGCQRPCLRYLTASSVKDMR